MKLFAKQLASVFLGLDVHEKLNGYHLILKEQYDLQKGGALLHSK